MMTARPCLLDTDVLIDYLRGQPQAKALFMQLPHDCAVSAVTVAELHVGVRNGPELMALKALLASMEVIDLGGAIASSGGLLRRDWGTSHGLGLNDALIAATALHSQRFLLTLNTKHFPMLNASDCAAPYVKI